MKPLIDTNVVSELMRREPDPRVYAWAVEHTSFHLSVVALEELVFGLTKRALPMKRQWLDGFLEAQCVILPVTPGIASASGQLRGSLSARGQTRTAADMLIAATALIHGLPLATRNTSDFAGIGLTLIDPFV